MRTYFAMLLLASVVSFLMTPLARRLAFRVGAVDRPDPRKIHRTPTARLGGLAVITGFSLPLFALFFLDNQVARIFLAYRTPILTLIGCGLVMFLLGVVDDIRGVRPGTKLAAQVVIAAVMYWGGFKITVLSSPLGGSFQLGWFAMPVTILWIVSLTNAINLLDGMDGLVAGVAAVLCLSLAMINILGGTIVVALLTFALAGAALGFLPYNFVPARIFLGDCGSLFVGVVLAGISTLSLFKAATAALVLVPLLLFALPLFDTVQVVVGRLRRGQHPFSADKTHVHHRLLALGLNQKQAAAILYSITLFLGVSAVILSWRLNASVFVGILVAGAGLTAAILHLSRLLRPPPATPAVDADASAVAADAIPPSAPAASATISSSRSLS